MRVNMSRILADRSPLKKGGANEKVPLDDTVVHTFLADLSRRIDISNPEDWYKIQVKQIKEAGGQVLLRERGSVMEIAKLAFPNEDWLPWKFSPVPRLYWREKKNLKRYLDWLGQRLGYSKREDWYKVQLSDFAVNHGRSMIETYYKSSPYALLSDVYDDYVFLPWRFTNVPSGYFDNSSNRRCYVDWLMKTVGLSDAKELRWNHFAQNHGNGLLAKYNGSMQLILQSLAEPNSSSGSRNDSNINRGNLNYTPKHYWASMENQKAFFDQLGMKLGFKDRAAWYNVSFKDVASNGGTGLLARYGNSLADALAAVYRDYEWLPWKFTVTPREAWRDATVLKKAVKAAEKELNILRPDEWHRVTIGQLRELGMAQYFTSNGGIFSVVQRFYPDLKWDDQAARHKQIPKDQI